MKIRQLGDPILRQKSLAVGRDEFQTHEIDSVIQTLKQVLDGIKAISDENGNALSAPQIGKLKRIIMLRIDGVFTPMINPVIIDASDEMFDFVEECFSFYNLRATVQRYKQINVQFQNEDGRVQQITVSGEMSGLIQHEIDHLDGIFFLDHVKKENNIASVDYILKYNPQRLKIVRKMMDYMVS